MYENIMWGVRTESLQLTPEPRVSGGGDAGPWSVMCYHCTMGVCRGEVDIVFYSFQCMEILDKRKNIFTIFTTTQMMDRMLWSVCQMCPPELPWCTGAKCTWSCWVSLCHTGSVYPPQPWLTAIMVRWLPLLCYNHMILNKSPELSQWKLNIVDGAWRDQTWYCSW